MSRTRSNKTALTHLIVGNTLSKSFDKFHNLSRISSLIHEPSRCAFCQQLPRSTLNLFQCAVKTVNKGRRDERSASVPG